MQQVQNLNDIYTVVHVAGDGVLFSPGKNSFNFADEAFGHWFLLVNASSLRALVGVYGLMIKLLMDEVDDGSGLKLVFQLHLIKYQHYPKRVDCRREAPLNFA